MVCLDGDKNMEVTLNYFADEQTISYLRKIVPINAKRMMVEGVEFWWMDEVLITIFAGLIKTGLLALPEKTFLQALEIARICDAICKEEKIACSIFILSPGGMKVHEYEETMKRSFCRLLV